MYWQFDYKALDELQLMRARLLGLTVFKVTRSWAVWNDEAKVVLIGMDVGW